MPLPLLSLSLHDALEAIDAADVGLLALGLPSCPACELLEVSLSVIARSRPRLTVAHTELAGDDEWSLRETLLWPRGIRPSRSSMPLLVLLRDGAVVGQRFGGGPAHVIDGWLTDLLGPADRALTTELDPAEQQGLVEVAALRQRHLAARGRLTG